MRKQKDEPIDMLILRTLLFGPIRGHTIAKSIERTSQDVLRVDHGLSPDRGRPQAIDGRDR